MLTRNQLLFLLAGIITEWCIFKYFYPYPDFFGDSYAYLFAASQDLNIQIWPIGYSKFLNLIPILSHSSLGLVTTQYLLVEFSALFFFKTVLKIYVPGKGTKLFLTVILFFNPLILFLSNYVSSEPIFFALSLFWITLLLIIINKKPTTLNLVIQAAVILFAYTFRYNAMYYPFVSLVAIAYAQLPLWKKISASLLAPLLILTFIWFSSIAGKKLTGKPIASVLSGWQIANNALYIRNQVGVKMTDFPNQNCQYLDEIAIHFYSKVGPGFKGYLNNYAGNYFIQSWSAPLKTYLVLVYGNSSIHSWADASTTFYQYGESIIKNHPLAFFHYYVIPNAKFYFLPPLEKLEEYNMGLDTVSPIAIQWFKYSSQKIKYFSNSIQSIILSSYPYVFLVLNILLPVFLIIILRNRAKVETSFLFGFVLIATFWLSNMFFSIVANTSVLRYQFFPLILLLAFSALFFDAAERSKINLTIKGSKKSQKKLPI